MNQKDALELIFTKQNGEIQFLEDSIGEQMMEEFSLVGFLTQGVTHKEGRNIPTWKITKLGSEIYQSIYQEPTEPERKKGAFCHSIGM